MDGKWCVYKHTNTINNKVYIGITKQIPKYRWGGNGQNYKSPHFSSAINLYGWNNLKHEILYNNLTKEEAENAEIRLIKKYNSTDPNFGYNEQVGGNIRIANDRTKERQSISAMNRPIVSHETKKKLSKASYGIKRTDETKKKMSLSAYAREKEKKEKNITGKCIKVKCLNTGHVFDSLRAAADWCGLCGTSGISLVCKNKYQKTAGVHPDTKEKLKWEYYIEEDE